MKKIILLAIFATLTFAHSGRTDSSGGHRSKYGGYHYHGTSSVGGTFSPDVANRLSASGSNNNTQNNPDDSFNSGKLQSEISSLKIKLQKQIELVNQLKTTCLNLKKENKILRELLADANIPLPDMFAKIKAENFDPNNGTAKFNPVQEPNKQEPLFKIDKSEKTQTERKELLKKLISNGIFKKIETPASLVHVWVASEFNLIDYAAKKSFLEVVYCYYYDGNDPGDSVILKDNLTGKRIGSYHPSLGLDMK